MGTRSEKLNHVVILDDGKKGHLKQSLAIAQNIVAIDGQKTSLSSPLASPLGSLGRARKGNFLPLTDTDFKIAFIHYKTKLHRLFLSLLCGVPLNSFFAKQLLSLCLTKNSFKELQQHPCDIVISTGSSLNAVNILYSSWRRCKNIVVMKPSWGRNSQYSLQIVPRHDNPKKKKNIIITLGAPSLSNMDIAFNAPIGKHPFDTESSQWRHLMLGVLIGGNSKYHFMNLDFIDEFISKIKKLNINFLITTSSRTPLEVSKKIHEHFSKHYTESIDKIFELCSTVLITEDSISMISEALNAGKKVIVLKIPTKKEDFKHRRMIHSLEQEGFIMFTSIALLEQAMLEKNKLMPLLQDNILIQEALRKL